jgi:hypothetical protein
MPKTEVLSRQEAGGRRLGLGLELKAQQQVPQEIRCWSVEALVPPPRVGARVKVRTGDIALRSIQST